MPSLSGHRVRAISTVGPKSLVGEASAGGTVREMTTGLPEVIVDARTVVLVEGVSDQRAVQALAVRTGRDLLAESIAVLPMGGATNIGHFLARYGPHGMNLGLAGLCDIAELRFFQRGFERAGLGPVAGRTELAAHRFYVCDADLEDELIRALGVLAVEQLLAEQGDLASFRTFQQQPAQQGKSDSARLRRFMGTRGGRKIHYAPLLVQALDLRAVPRPLAHLVETI